MDGSRMANRSGSHYLHKVLEAEGTRRRERHFVHQRTLDDQRAASPGVAAMSRFHRVTRGLFLSRRTVPTGQGAFCLTDVECDLAGGARGRVGVRRHGGDWVAACIAPGGALELG